MALIILGIVGALIIAAASVAGLLISAEAEMRERVGDASEGQPKLG
ncbi:hypothetical protein [Pelagibacterium luteolum]|uniref:Uncharacterized protein n=1 Tax=Pelagibacterium luteolum TaxID=440168 RepID=A0A1G7U072_9HYPH|nr:hypothetical protein [Pelagibacterium luteolum]SDG40754.1 hypothetical protein SAMN04487974_102452 [Pelagibacterium luteolum]